jgi:Na+/H+ antiporter NhaD/arsenite permease-like protein
MPYGASSKDISSVISLKRIYNYITAYGYIEVNRDSSAIDIFLRKLSVLAITVTIIPRLYESFIRANVMSENSKRERETERDPVTRTEGTHFFRRNYGYVVIVNVFRLLHDYLGIAFSLELLAGHPEGDILLAVLALEELVE